MYLAMGCSAKVAELSANKKALSQSFAAAQEDERLGSRKKRSAASRFMQAMNPFSKCTADPDGVVSPRGVGGKRRHSQKRGSFLDISNGAIGSEASGLDGEESLDVIGDLRSTNSPQLTASSVPGGAHGSFHGSFHGTLWGSFGGNSGGLLGPSSLSSSSKADESMLQGSRSEAPRCANCRKEADKSSEELTQRVQPFRDAIHAGKCGAARSAPTGLTDVGMVFCDEDCYWTYTLGGGAAKRKHVVDPSHPAGAG